MRNDIRSGRTHNYRFTNETWKFINESLQCDGHSYNDQDDLFVRAGAGDEDARNNIVCCNMGLVFDALDSVLARSSYCAPYHDELFEAALFELGRCIVSFDPDYGKFSSYAFKCICFAVRKEIEGVSIEEPDEDITYGNSENIGPDGVSDECEVRAFNEQIESVINRALSPEEAKIVRLRYGLEDGKEYKNAEIGKIFGCTDSYIGKRTKRDVEDIRKYIEDNSIDFGFAN